MISDIAMVIRDDLTIYIYIDMRAKWLSKSHTPSNSEASNLRDTIPFYQDASWECSEIRSIGGFNRLEVKTPEAERQNHHG